ncbi:hypothetical protein JOF28_002376 [Leucobacter exalbidus]|uniref:Uncharacterized protein n=1 Tax=Leucobacter exalbidus TaxID=662960 RepID=A0A940PXG5_9MICO|nr:hypothetical protein [Leucobacter exalbidus]MBP1327144.1 hypothetical protein [Leucobacter exalbidus]
MTGTVTCEPGTPGVPGTVGTSGTPGAPGTPVVRRNRRATRPAPAGVDPRPSQHALTSRASEDRPEGWGDASASKQVSSYDAELQRDKPPHWG